MFYVTQRSLAICGLLLGLGLAPATFAQTPDNTKEYESQ